MKTYSADRLYWLKHHIPVTREEYLDITAHANVLPPAFPRTVYIEIGASCNLNCTFCSKPSRRAFLSEMTQETIHRVITECGTHGTYGLYFHLFNEPLLHCHKLLPAITHAKTVGIPIVAVTTNITPLTKHRMGQLIVAGLDTIHLSFEGANKTTYEQSRGVSYAVIRRRIFEALEVRAKIGKTNDAGRLMPWMAISMVHTTESQDEIDAFLTEWKGHVDDIEVRPALGFLGRTQAGIAIQPVHRVPCRYMGDRLIIAADGTVTGCSVDVDAALNLGNVSEGDTLTSIWQSQRYRELWALHQWERWEDLPEPCRSCDSWDFTATQRSQHLHQTLR